MMNIIACVISLISAGLSFLQNYDLFRLLNFFRNNPFGLSRNAQILTYAVLLVMVASIVGIVGGIMAMTKKKGAFVCLCLSAVMSTIGFFITPNSSPFGEMQYSYIYAILYAVAAFCAYIGSSSTEEQASSTQSTSTFSSKPQQEKSYEPILLSVNSQEENVVSKVSNLIAPQINKKNYEPIPGFETEALIKRAFLFLEDGEFDNAGRYLEQALNQDPENARVYFGQLMLNYEAHDVAELINNLSTPIEDEKLFQRALKFADEEYKKELDNLAQAIRDKLEQERLAKEAEQEAEHEKCYQEIINLKDTVSTVKEFDHLLGLIQSISPYKDTEELYIEVTQTKQEKLYQEILNLKSTVSTIPEINNVLELINSIKPYKDTEALRKEISQTLEKETKYQNALWWIKRYREHKKSAKSEEIVKLIHQLAALNGYKDTKELLTEANETLKQIEKRKNRKSFLVALIFVVSLILIFARHIASPFVDYQIGRIYEEGNFFVEKNLDKAREWYLSVVGLEDKDNDRRDPYQLGLYEKFDLAIYESKKNKYILQSYREKAYIAFLHIDAERGNAEAQVWLAGAYYYANGVERDYSKAFEWYKKAAEQEEYLIQHYILAKTLAEMYEKGEGVEKNIDEAHKWYLKVFEYCKKKAEQGDYNAQYHLAEMYEKGKGVEKNINEAIKWYQKVVEVGERSSYKDEALEAIKRLTKEAEEARIARENVMIAFFEGRYDDITSPDNFSSNSAIVNMLAHIDYEKAGANYDTLIKQAEDLRIKSPSSSNLDYKEAIELAGKYPNSNSANKFLGDVYLNGWGAGKDTQKALSYFKVSAEQGDVYSQIALASIYDSLNDKDNASKWYQKLADSGNALAQDKLRAFQEQQKKQEADRAYSEAQASEANGNLDTALEQYRRALELGHPEAQKSLTALENKIAQEKAEQERRVQEIQEFQSEYSNGEKYLNDKDYSQALEIFRRLAVQGYAPAQDKLAWMYQNGWGIEQSYTQAVYWFRKAAEQGNPEALASMGLMYLKGWGVEQNYDTSLEWYKKAAAKGSTVAERRINSIEILKVNKQKIASLNDRNGFPLAGKIFAETLSVRQSANAKSRVIKTLRTGHPVSISRAIDIDSDYWFYIKTASGTEGWVLAGYVTIIDRDLTYEEINNRRYSLPKSGYVTTSSSSSFLNLRNIPAIEGSQVVEKLDNRTYFMAYEIFAGDTIDWYRVKPVSSNREGWVSGKYIELNF